jgi:phospholipase C
MDLRRIAFGTAAAALIVALAGPLTHSGAQGPDDAMLARGKIDHVVVIVMENRTFDNVFGGDNVVLGHPAPYPGADAVVPTPIASAMLIADFDQRLIPSPAPGSAQPPGPNNWHDTYQCVASGAFSNAAWQANASSPMTCSGLEFTSPNGPFYYLDAQDRAVYWAVARQFEIGDAFFAPGSTDSYPGHQFIVAGRSSDADGDEIVDQPFYGYSQYAGTTGCADVLSGSARPGPTPAILVPALGPPSSPWAVPTMRGFEGECYTAETFADKLVERQRARPQPAATLTWTHYATATSIPSPYGGGGAFNGFINNAGWWNHVWPPAKQVIADARQGRLPTFAWVKPPCVPASDHPGTGNGGPSWVEDVVNAIGSRPDEWGHTAIFVVWDDWGGFYDHVVPPSPRAWDRLGPGLRTPFLVISPYVKPGNVAHGISDYGSILRFVEQLFDVGSLGGIDAHSPDLRGFFDFSTSHPFAPVTARPTVSWTTLCPKADPRQALDFRD